MCRCAGVQASEANEGELASFVAYACAFPAKCLCLVDNYDVIRYCWLWRDCMYRGVGWLPCPTSDVQKQLMEVCARVSSSVCCPYLVSMITPVSAVCTPYPCLVSELLALV